MESLERSSAVIDLGKRLVTQLKLGDDDLAQWMAHALAERIKDAENALLRKESQHKAPVRSWFFNCGSEDIAFQLNFAP